MNFFSSRPLFLLLFITTSLYLLASNIFAEENIVPRFSQFDGAYVSDLLEEGSYRQYTFASLDDDGVPIADGGGFSAQEDATIAGAMWKPLSFSVDGLLSITARIPSDSSASSATLRFVFERSSYDTNGQGIAATVPKAVFSSNEYVDVIISGSTFTTYDIVIPSQGNKTFSSLNMYILERDVLVDISEVNVTDDDVVPTVTPGLASSVSFDGRSWGTFNGFVNSNGTLSFPTGAASWAGSYITTPNAAPFTFNEDGSIVFEASVVDPDPNDGEVPTANIYFKFEGDSYPNNKPFIQTESIAVNSTTPQTFTVPIPTAKSYGYQTYNSLLFYIEDRDVEVVLGDITVNDDAYATETDLDNGVRFVFLDVEHSDTQSSDTNIFVQSPWVEVDSFTPKSYSVTFPGYAGEYAHELYDQSLTDDTNFNQITMYLAGRNQAISVRDIEIIVGGSTYGGQGSDSLNFFDGFEADYNSDTQTYYHSSGSADWGGFTNQSSEAPLGLNGAPLNEPITINFVAALSNEEFADPFVYSGETAFGNDGSIDTSVNVGSGDADDPYRWSGYVTWYDINSDHTKGTTRVGGNEWNILSEVEGTWADVNGDSVLTLKPNTASFGSFSNPGQTDGKYYLEQLIKIEGIYTDPDEEITENSALLGNTVNFAGTVILNDLDPRYTVSAYIQCSDTTIQNASPIINQTQVVLDSNGYFSLTLDLPEGIDENNALQHYVPSFGFKLEGRNANPITDWGEIQIKDIVANYIDINPITEGHFTALSGSSDYWSVAQGSNTIATFNDNGGNGLIKGQTTIIGGERGTKHIVSNNGLSENLDSFGLAANNIYNVSFYMNRQTGEDFGLVQFTFYDSNGNEISSSPSDPSINMHTGSTGEWTQATQSFSTPGNAVKALLKVYSGGTYELNGNPVPSVIHYDDITISYVGPNNVFSSWASSNGLSGAEALFNADPDGDGIPNGLENFLGTQPDAHTGSAMSNVAFSSNSLSMQHAKNSDIASDVTADYVWSTDLSTWNDSGATVNGTTVTITPVDDTPAAGTTTATATVSGTDVDSVFIKVSVSNE